MNVRLLIVILLLIGAGAIAFFLWQPSEQPREHPREHPQANQETSISKDDLAAAIENYVANETALKGGFFLVYDKGSSQTLALTLERVHRDKLSKVSETTYFVCADFVTPDGKTYDLDLFMKGPTKDKLAVTEISIHKENSEERYRWEEKNGVWSKAQVNK